ncbi:hypothetical protein LTR53_019025, partial [Teratosphaeriaceae sp. CCFEE 6253]
CTSFAGGRLDGIGQDADGVHGLGGRAAAAEQSVCGGDGDARREYGYRDGGAGGALLPDHRAAASDRDGSNGELFLCLAAWREFQPRQPRDDTNAHVFVEGGSEWQ